MTPPPTRHRIWPVPIALGIASAIGLVAGLVSDGVGDVIAWVGLALPLVAIAWSLAARG